MLFPSKVTSYKESIFPDVVSVAQIIKQLQHCSVLELYKSVQPERKDINKFIDALVFLFATSKVDLDKTSGEIFYVD